MGRIIYLYCGGMHNKPVDQTRIPKDINAICSETPFSFPIISVGKFLKAPIISLGLFGSFLIGKLFFSRLKDMSSLKQISGIRRIPLHKVDASAIEMIDFAASSFFLLNWSALIIPITSLLIFPVLETIAVWIFVFAVYGLLMQKIIAIGFRDKAMAENTLKIIKQRNYQKVFLYCGNAHVEGIKKRLQLTSIKVVLV